MKKVVVALFGLIALISAGCKKSGSTNNGIATVSGGKGGGASLTVTPEHHGQFVDSCIIYIKYATNDVPINGIYDDSCVCIMVDTTPVAIFTHLKAGSYYLFADGYHAGYAPPFAKGGLPHTIINDADSDRLFMATYSYNK